MQNKTFTATLPVAASAGNLLNSAVTSLTGPVGITLTQPVLTIKHIRANNKTGAAVTLTLYKGATGGSAAGTEFGFVAVSVPANSYLDYYSPGARFESTDFLTGIAGSVSAIVLDVEGEVGFQ
jgi:hypothetical protein